MGKVKRLWQDQIEEAIERQDFRTLRDLGFNDDEIEELIWFATTQDEDD